MSSAGNINHLIQQIEDAFDMLSMVMSHPEQVPFAAVASDFVRLEQAVNQKALIDASFAFIADRDGAGRTVGSTRTSEYLTKCLEISQSEAYSRLRRGQELFAPPTPPEPSTPAPNAEDESLFGEGSSADEAAQKDQEQRLREEEERRRREEAERQAKARARDEAKRISAEKQRIIDQELSHLNEHSDPSRAVLHAEALRESASRSCEDVRIWLRKRVKEANAKGRMPNGQRDPLAGHKKRYLHLNKQDADGNVRISGSLPAHLAAALEAALAPGLRAGANTTLEAHEDKRSKGMRAADQLGAILDSYLASEKSTGRKGIGSVVVSLTLDDLFTMEEFSEYLANTGHFLRPFDILMLGAAKHDICVLHDSEGQPLSLGLGTRSATIAQRVALFATEGLCTCGNCSVAAVHTDIHHLTPWSHGGPTDIDNLTGVCRPHHGDNNDRRDGAGGMGHMTRDPQSKRAGWQPPDGGPPHFNDTENQEHSAGAKIRRRKAQRYAAWEEGTRPHPSDRLPNAAAHRKPPEDCPF